MSNLNLRSITNHFQDVRLVSLSSWSRAKEIEPRDNGGPYVVIQEGYDPADLLVRADEFVLGRSGKWLSVGHFYRLPVAERRAEFVFGTAAEVMKIMGELPGKPVIMGREAKEPTREAAGGPTPEPDEMAAAIRAGKNQGGSAK
jgi:hypothetical protein